MTIAKTGGPSMPGVRMMRTPDYYAVPWWISVGMLVLAFIELGVALLAIIGVDALLKGWRP